MPPPRKNPPPNAAETIRNLATTGHSLVGIASHFGVSKTLLSSWLERFPLLEDAFEVGKDKQRQELHEMLYRKALEKNDTLAALSILNSLHGWRDPRKGGTDLNVNVDVKLQAVMVVKDSGTDEEWADKTAAQQARLTLDAVSPSHGSRELAAPIEEIEEAVMVPEPAFVVPVAPAMPSWMVSHLAKAAAPPVPVLAHYSDAPVWRGNA